MRGSMSGRTSPCSCAERSRSHVQLELGFEESGHELGADLFVDDALGGQGPGGDVERGVAEFIDGGAQDELEVGVEVAGVRDAVLPPPSSWPAAAASAAWSPGPGTPPAAPPPSTTTSGRSSACRRRRGRRCPRSWSSGSRPRRRGRGRRRRSRDGTSHCGGRSRGRLFLTMGRTYQGDKTGRLLRRLRGRRSRGHPRGRPPRGCLRCSPAAARGRPTPRPGRPCTGPVTLGHRLAVEGRVRLAEVEEDLALADLGLADDAGGGRGDREAGGGDVAELLVLVGQGAALDLAVQGGAADPGGEVAPVLAGDDGAGGAVRAGRRDTWKPAAIRRSRASMTRA